MAAGDQLTRISGSSFYWIDNQGKTLYYLEPEGASHRNAAGDLYKISIENQRVKEPVLCDSQVSPKCAGFLADGRFMYFKAFDQDKGLLYIDGIFVDKDVYANDIGCDEANKRVFYYTRHDAKTKNGTLKVFAGGKVTEIGQEVYSHLLLPGGDLLYLKDRSSSLGRSDLYLYKNRKSYMVDVDVTAIVPPVLPGDSREEYDPSSEESLKWTWRW